MIQCIIIIAVCLPCNPIFLYAAGCQLSSQVCQVATLEDSQLCHGTRMDEHDEALMQQQEKLQEVDEILKRLLRCQRAMNERLSMQVQAL